LLHRVQRPRVRRVEVAGEVVDEVVLGQPDEAERVEVEVRQRRGGRAVAAERRDRLALVEPERRDVDEPDDVRRVGAQMTALQLEPSAQAPWTRTMCGKVGMSAILSLWGAPNLLAAASPQENDL
jgi:hypothetical protein